MGLLKSLLCVQPVLPSCQAFLISKLPLPFLVMESTVLPRRPTHLRKRHLNPRRHRDPPPSRLHRRNKPPYHTRVAQPLQRRAVQRHDIRSPKRIRKDLRRGLALAQFERRRGRCSIAAALACSWCEWRQGCGVDERFGYADVVEHAWEDEGFLCG